MTTKKEEKKSQKLALKLLYLTINLILILSTYTSQIYAKEPQKNGIITITPAFQEIILTSDSTPSAIPITITNNSQQQIDLNLSVTDITQQDFNSDISFNTNPNSPYQLTPYIDLSDTNISINSLRSATISATLKPHPLLYTYGHYGAILANFTSTASSTPTGIHNNKISPSLASILLVKTDQDPTAKLNITSNTFPKSKILISHPKSFNISLQNQGNIHVFPYGTIEIHDIFNRKTHKGIINPSSSPIFPLTTQDIIGTISQIDKQLPISINTLTIKGHDSLNLTTFSYTHNYIFIHPLTIVVSLPFLFFTISAIIIYKKKK